MLEVREVSAQISANQVCEGFYTLEGGLLTMVHHDGRPVSDGAFHHRMIDGDNELAIAKMLTKKVRSHLRGETVPGFGNPIDYPNAGVA